MHFHKRPLIVITTFFITLGACTPIAGGPPPNSIPSDMTQEFGTSSTAAITSESPFIQQNLWYRKTLGAQSEIQFAGGVGLGSGIAYYGALGYRRYFKSVPEKTQLGIDLKLGGPFYFEAGLPMSKQLDDYSVWITTHPSVGFNSFGLVHIPVGLSWRPQDSFQLNTSIGTRFLGGNPMILYWNGGASFPF
jgi:hypothetical protein